MSDDPTPTLTVHIDADTEDLRAQLAEVSRLGARLGTTLSAAFVDVALRGRGLSDVLRTLALRLSEIALKAAFKPLTERAGRRARGRACGRRGLRQGWRDRQSDARAVRRRRRHCQPRSFSVA
jgi:hypothetical protein